MPRLANSRTIKLVTPLDASSNIKDDRTYVGRSWACITNSQARIHQLKPTKRALCS